MNGILETKFYAVNIEDRIIVDTPYRREVDVARDFRGHGPWIAMRGKHLLGAKSYETFKRISDAPQS